MDKYQIVKRLEYCVENKCDICQEENGSGFPWIDGRCYGFTERLYDALALLESQEPITGETSDGYHTFNELYHHRAVLFSVIVNNYKDLAWKSVRHHDGTMYDGMFIVGIDTPDGQATYHYDINPYWDMFDCKVREFAPEWDGHTPAQAIERIGKLKTQEPVRHGRWSEKRWMTEDDWGVINHRAIVCSACKGEIADGEKTCYCPNCGAKMDKEK